ncbi:btk-binding protein-related [Anaeramoeba flamelloides]|uniref:Btk-binding protein-related n=1 Tax=Anaeramoeba flamelloides TaxID=1746091 RepID=A0AAV7YBS1_9EUKA|nr:btk-binding protein-related [Anaeramoeba flamelloides]
MFTGNLYFGFFFVTSKVDLLYACGSNRFGHLGIGLDGDESSKINPTVVKNIKGSEILTIGSGCFQTTLMTNKEKKAVQLTTGHIQNLVLTDQNELYAWRIEDELFPTDEDNNKNIPTKISLPNIAQLYKYDDSKDFKILVKIEDKKEKDENEDEKDKEDNYEEIPVHKFILLARSGLFREMFDYVNEKENTNKVKDYSHKSIESLKILIKYFYTNSIQLTANEEPEIIVDELSDAVEYYQLNDQCNLGSELNKIKKQFELN